jgi:hypothetical protein
MYRSQGMGLWDLRLHPKSSSNLDFASRNVSLGYVTVWTMVLGIIKAPMDTYSLLGYTDLSRVVSTLSKSIFPLNRRPHGSRI